MAILLKTRTSATAEAAAPPIGGELMKRGNSILMRKLAGGALLVVTLPTLAIGEVQNSPVLQGPEFAWGSYFGGDHDDYATSVAVDSEGNTYFAGTTYSAGWVQGGYDTEFSGTLCGYFGQSSYCSDAFVVKLSPTGEHLWSAYLGGTGEETAEGLALDLEGNIYVTGTTDSEGWLSGGPLTEYDMSDYDACGDIYCEKSYLVKLSADGDHLWSTYVGGPQREGLSNLTVDSAGNALVSGYTTSNAWGEQHFGTELPSAGTGVYDSYVVKFSSEGIALWHYFLGASPSALATDKFGNLYVVGSTGSPDWASGGYNTTYSGDGDGFVLKLSANGRHLWSTYLGGEGPEYATAVDIGPTGDVYVGGLTESSGWVNGGYQTNWGSNYHDRSGFVVRLNAGGQHVWSTYVGGNQRDEVNALFVDEEGSVYLGGETDSRLWTYGNSFTGVFAQGTRGFLMRLSDNGTHVWSTYLGGSDGYVSRIALNAIHLDRIGNLWAVGHSGPEPWDVAVLEGTHAGSRDAFAVRIEKAERGVSARRGLTVASFTAARSHLNYDYLNTDLLSTSYSTLLFHLRAKMDVNVLQFDTLTEESLESVDVFFANIIDHDAPFTAAERQALRTFVERGGGVIAFTEHTNFVQRQDPITTVFGPAGVSQRPRAPDTTITLLNHPIAQGPFGWVDNDFHNYIPVEAGAFHLDTVPEGGEIVALAALEGEAAIVALSAGRGLPAGAGRAVLFNDLNFCDTLTESFAKGGNAAAILNAFAYVGRLTVDYAALAGQLLENLEMLDTVENNFLSLSEIHALIPDVTMADFAVLDFSGDGQLDEEELGRAMSGEEPEGDEPLYGDVNGDDQVTFADALATFYYARALQNESPAKNTAQVLEELNPLLLALNLAPIIVPEAASVSVDGGVPGFSDALAILYYDRLRSNTPGNPSAAELLSELNPLLPDLNIPAVKIGLPLSNDPEPEQPSVTSLSINGGASTTTTHSVTLNNVATGSPTEYQASEDDGFADAIWQPYAEAPTFELSSGAGTKTVYFRVRNAAGPSPSASDTIVLESGSGEGPCAPGADPPPAGYQCVGTPGTDARVVVRYDFAPLAGKSLWSALLDVRACYRADGTGEFVANSALGGEQRGTFRWGIMVTPGLQYLELAPNVYYLIHESTGGAPVSPQWLALPWDRIENTPLDGDWIVESTSCGN